jgi:hypothetical protein
MALALALALDLFHSEATGSRPLPLAFHSRERGLLRRVTGLVLNLGAILGPFYRTRLTLL